MAKNHVLTRNQHFARPLTVVFAFFSSANNLEAITPPSLRFTIRSPQPIVMAVGATIEYELSLFGIPIYWQTVISVWEPPYRFVDEQQKGPFFYWRHEHSFEQSGDQVLMRDRVEYREPLGWLGLVAHHLLIKRLLDAVFTFRRLKIAEVLAPIGT